MVGGATLTGLIGTSAWYAPGAAGMAVVESILRDEKKNHHLLRLSGRRVRSVRHLLRRSGGNRQKWLGKNHRL